MDDRLVECLPNFSEARRPEVIDQIIHEIQLVDHVVLLDRHSDLDHNRTILSFLGHPQAVEKAAYRAIRIAAELIDMNQHTGHHPRIGAADVVPFVPIRNFSMDECVALSRRLAERVGGQLNLPVYLYDQSAARPDRQHLDDLRRGEYEQLKTAIESDPNRVPDYGPPVLGPAGAVIIGARNHLVTFNVYLNTPNLEPAQRIAKCIRHSSGGLRFVDAAGIPLEGKAVVSLVVTDFQRTRLSRIFEMIEAEAAHLGVRIEYTRIVGLIPMQALLDTAAWKLRLSNFESDQILETHLDQACRDLLDENTGAGFLDQLASTAPTPAGGSAAAFTAAQAAALLVMIAGITLSKKKYASVHAQMQAILQNAHAWQAQLADYVQIDARAYEDNITAARLPQGTPAQKQYRADQLQHAAYRSAEIPLECARLAIQVMRAAETLAASGNLSTIGDAAAASALARSAISVFINNIRLNLKSYRQQDRAAAIIREAEQIDEQAGQSFTQTQQILQTRGEI